MNFIKTGLIFTLEVLLYVKKVWDLDFLNNRILNQ